MLTRCGFGPSGVLAMLAVAFFTLSAGGCKIFGAGAKVLEPKKRAMYELGKAPVLIVVDDPYRALGDADLPRKLSNAIAYELNQNSAAASIIPQEKLMALARDAGDGFIKIPLDKLGRDLGAKQVINVNVERAELMGTPGTLRPAMEVRVRVIDADTGHRLFPEDKNENDDPIRSVRGMSVVSMLYYKPLSEDSRIEISKATEKLINRTARNVGRLFYDYYADEPGELMREDH